ncbi:hypothetical protein ACQ26G_004349 [Yersinia enterocolitica]|uniref:hypothetical protein n=1 Tax=Yersinia enterocolitica TaxID=630 RepID=UPI0025AB34E5|nr:hypothetical protein [Yersinia enterocolitica]ELI7923492.1 hypothetical protein [Yersinia enterocolitica]MDN0097792.1 hypothetical protein [Yersinia enterocolitica]HEI6727803.1 hypothetical protein [Yersinia enterocolitica]HEI6740092.1 hypothetical protein [Yersinia enterocolitica]HEI6818179.1 hypothetical protein [Yersinia enterocolitica]
MKKILLILTTAMALSGCSSQFDSSPLGDPSLKAEVEAPLICNGEKECNLFWQRAQFWVANNSAWKIETATDTLISTHNSQPDRADLAYQVTRLPNPDGTARIYIKPFCANMFGCRPKPYEAIVAFKRFVKSGA